MQVRHTNQRRNGFTGNARRRPFSCTIYAAVKGTTSAVPVSHAPLARRLSASPAAPRARPQNDKGQNVDLYIPRKCSWTHRLITVHDHAAIQVRVASGRRAAAALPRSLVFTAGAPAPTSLAPPPFSLQVHVAKVDVDGKAIRGQEDTYAICGYVRDKVRWPSLWPRARLRATDEPVPPRTMCWLRHSSGQNRCLYFAVPSLLSLSLSLSPSSSAGRG